MFEKTRGLLKGLALGAGAMYLLDPQYGATRRGKLKGQLVRAGSDYGKLWEKGSQDLANRVRGHAYEAKGLLSGETVDDETVERRVRSAAGHVLTDAGGLRVEARDGVVTLGGTVRPGEPDLLAPAVEKVRGVRSVESLLATAGEPIPHRPQTGLAANLPTGELTPGARLGIATVGVGLLARALLKRGPLALPLGAAGLALFQKGRRGGRIEDMFGLGDAPRPLRLDKTVHIDAPRQQVYEFLLDAEQSRRFFPGHWEIETLADGRHRWGTTFAGADLHCEEVVTEAAPHEKVVWQSTPDSLVQYEGLARFQPEGDGTRLDVHLNWLPPGGSLGEIAARAFRLDPKSMLDEGLKRCKMHLEDHAVRT
ncbi:MAG: SRPBCC family protein [Planctomycetota bacterium]